MKNILENIDDVINDIQNFEIQSISDKLEFQRKFSGKEGLLPQVLSYFKNLESSEKKKLGPQVNRLKNVIEEKIKTFNSNIKRGEISFLDPTRPLDLFFPGSCHVLNLVTEEVCKIFNEIGFEIAEGPEVEDEFHNFSALNFPEHHPARDMQDTFFLDVTGKSWLLRTHTSPVQIRVMQTGKPPFRFLAPGKVFRCDHDATHSPVFHQIEGLFVDKDVRFSDLKGTLEYFVVRFFGPGTQIRFRPSFFPFTEPSAEVDVLWSQYGNRWLEILGCGMVHRKVLENCGLDPEDWRGFAFGMGVERLAMLRYGIDDIRLFYENDLRFLSAEMDH